MNARMDDDRWVSYNFAVLRVVPHVHLGTFVNIGVILHARTAEFLGMRCVTDAAVLRQAAADTDVDLLVRYLDSLERICRGDASAGPVALLPPSERFHWLVAPRSDVLQSSPVHAGLCRDPAIALDQLFADLVRLPEPPRSEAAP
jgi:hypothetical protein